MVDESISGELRETKSVDGELRAAGSNESVLGAVGSVGSDLEVVGSVHDELASRSINDNLGVAGFISGKLRVARSIDMLDGGYSWRRMIRVVDGLDTGAWMGSDLGSSFLFFN